MELFRFILPKVEICSERELYFRSDEVIYDEKTQRVYMNRGAIISFDTYFNCFSYSKYKKYTFIDSVGISLTLKGKFLIRLMAARIDHTGPSKEILQEHTIEFEAMNEYKFIHSFVSDNTEGIYYIELTAMSDEAVYFSGYYFIDETEHHINKVKVAVVICTYKRENFVYRNINTVTNYIFNNSLSPVRKNLSFFIIDNGNSIDPSLVESEDVEVFNNKNYGGSGGFTRGIIEAYKRHNEFTHVLLMDDDILFEGEVLVKTLNFLKVLNAEHLDICIGAGMLRDDRPYIQHEAGAYWEGTRVRSIKHNFDLRQIQKLILNEYEEFINYSGWWYTCIPLNLVEENNFPLPLFIKIDDMEYSLRLSKKILLMNGIGVWHEHFDFKYNAYLEYYIKRNETILTSLHFPQFGALASIKKLLLAMGKNHLKRRYSAHYFLLRAYDDFLKGIDFLLNTDEEKLNIELVKHFKNPSRDGSIVYFPILLVYNGVRFLFMSIKIMLGYNRAADSYRKRLKEVTSFEFWCNHLEIEKENSNDKKYIAK